jgi:hypothetical protein
MDIGKPVAVIRVEPIKIPVPRRGTSAPVVAEREPAKPAA